VNQVTAPHRSGPDAVTTGMTDILVLGAGYAGLAAAFNLAGRTGHRTDVTITVVNATDRFTERLRLHQNAAGQHTAALDVPSHLHHAGARFHKGRVTGLDPDARTITVDGRTLAFDLLVYALGAVTDTTAVPGADTAHTLDSPDTAERLARQLPTTRRIAVCGSGLTGVEAACELAETHPHLDVTLVGRTAPGDHLGPRARAHLRAALDRLGVTVRTGADIVKIRPDGVDLADGDQVTADTVLWTGGVRVPDLPATAGLTVDGQGRIVTDPALRSVSHPHIWAVGDAAAVHQPYGTLHGTCQSGMPTGVHAAVAIARTLDGHDAPAFRFGYYHTPVSLGRHDAVVQFTRPDGSPRRMCLTGRAAVRYKETVSASPWPTYRRMTTFPRLTAVWPRGGRATR
jgi:NADH dehydrogenase